MAENEKKVPENQEPVVENPEVIDGEATEYNPPEVISNDELDDANGNGILFLPIGVLVTANAIANANVTMNANAVTNANVTAVANANEAFNANVATNANTT